VCSFDFYIIFLTGIWLRNTHVIAEYRVRVCVLEVYYLCFNI